jgi:hypothetical protein
MIQVRIRQKDVALGSFQGKKKIWLRIINVVDSDCNFSCQKSTSDRPSFQAGGVQTKFQLDASSASRTP